MRRAGRARRRLAHVVDLAPLSTAVVAPPVAYLSLLTGTAWWSTRRQRRVRRSVRCAERRFAVLIPAHDEEALIGDTLRSLHAVEYPADMVAIHVVADHCTDGTVDIARSAGVDVHEHIDPEPRGKGPALQWLYRRLRDRSDAFDTVLVIDADTLVSANLLSALDARFAAGARVVQAHYTVRDVDGHPGAGLRAAALALRHFVRPLGRTALGGSCGLYGNGMAFDVDVLDRRQWSDHLTEDLEFQTDLVLDGVTVDFAPEAVVTAEMPHTLAAARSQNQRWERGRLDLARRYLPRLLRATRTASVRQRIALVDTGIDHLVPPMSVLAVSTGLSVVVTWVAASVRPTAANRLARGISSATLAALLAHIVVGLRLARVPAAVYRSLLRAPLLVAWKVALWTEVLVGGDDIEWTRTRRNVESAPRATTA